MAQEIFGQCIAELETTDLERDRLTRIVAERSDIEATHGLIDFGNNTADFPGVIRIPGAQVVPGETKVVGLSVVEAVAHVSGKLATEQSFYTLVSFGHDARKQKRIQPIEVVIT